MRLFWVERRHEDVPGGDEWLSVPERQTLARLRFPKRRDDWRLGRWAAKCAVAAIRPQISDFRDITVHQEESGAPAVLVHDRPAGLSVSLSHSSGRGFCVVADGLAAIGCDVEAVEARSQEFVLSYFTAAERALVDSHEARFRPETVNLIWSAKESVSKALRMGLRLSLPSVTVEPVGAGGNQGGWRLLRAATESRTVFHGWWRSEHGFVRTVLSDPGPLPLTSLDPAISTIPGKAVTLLPCPSPTSVVRKAKGRRSE